MSELEKLKDVLEVALRKARFDALHEAANIADGYGSCACDTDMRDAILALTVHRTNKSKMQSLLNTYLNLALADFLYENDDVSLEDVQNGIADFTSDADAIHENSQYCGYCKGGTEENLMHCPYCN
jgi:hypothetical protein